MAVPARRSNDSPPRPQRSRELTADRRPRTADGEPERPLTGTTTHLTPENLEYLASIVGADHVSADRADLDQHSRDQSFHPAGRPQVVVWPGSADEISRLLAYANQHRIPVTPWGAGTSLEGNPNPVQGGIVLDMNRMDRILEVRGDDFQVDVQPGLRYKELNAALEGKGLFFAPDPGANASLGGMIANNAAGTRTPGYGATRDNVHRLEVVLASGDIVRLGTRASKTASGYDLVRLFVGSEGTLGVVTEATLRLAPLPAAVSAVIASFPSAQAASECVSQIIGRGLAPVALELLGASTVRALNASGEFQLPEQATLLIEFHGAGEAGLQQVLAMAEQICTAAGCTGYQSGLGRQQRDRLWRARHRTYEILVQNNPGRAFLIGDVAVAVSDYPKMVAVIEREMAARDLQGYLVGHAGDGNVHPFIPYTPGDQASYSIAAQAEAAMVEAALGMGGTATGEHGIGVGKRRFMEREHGPGLDVMRAVKGALDPNGILNPGKIF